MTYYKLEIDYTPSITGKRNGGAAVEIKDKESFFSDSDKKIWKEFHLQEIKNGRERCSWESYALFNNDAFGNPICFYPTGKRVKQLDFMTFAPYMRSLQFLVSDKVYNIISNFRLQIHNVIPAKIDTFGQKYYLLGFPTLYFNYFDFGKSIFKNYVSDKEGVIETEDEYMQLFINGCVKTVKIQLNTKFNVDIIHVPGASFFSSDIIELFEKEKITGYIRCKEVLEN